MHILVHNMFFNIIFYFLTLNPNLKPNSDSYPINNPNHKLVYEPKTPLTFIYTLWLKPDPTNPKSKNEKS